MIEWVAEMETGVQKIDDQHKKILEKFNEFSAVLTGAKFTGEKMIEAGKVLDFLQFYAIWHFEKEEEYFAEFDCPGAKANATAHKKFRQMFSAFYEKWQRDGMEIGLALRTFDELANWFSEHIIKIDTQLYGCAKDTEK